MLDLCVKVVIQIQFIPLTYIQNAFFYECDVTPAG